MACMPRYLVVRTFEVSEDAMPNVGRRSREIAEEEFPEITSKVLTTRYLGMRAILWG